MVTTLGNLTVDLKATKVEPVAAAASEPPEKSYLTSNRTSSLTADQMSQLNGNGGGSSPRQGGQLYRTSTMEFIGGLLKGVDTPDEPLPQLFDGLSSDFNMLSGDGGYPRHSTTLQPFLNTIVAKHARADELAASALALMPPSSPVFGATGVRASNALKRAAPPPELPLIKISDLGEATPPHKRSRRIASAPAATGPPRWGSAPGKSGAAGVGRQPIAPLDITLVLSKGGAAVLLEPAKKAKNPKRADRRRTIARFTTAILRAGGSNAFIARDGLGYRKAFDRFLVETYGDTFGEGGYWYENARVEPFFRVLFHIATEGRIQLSEEAVNLLFCKREKRQAAEWLLDEEELAKFGVTATELAAIFEGPCTLSVTGYPRGTPLQIPTDAELDNGTVPRTGAAVAASRAAAQDAANA
eukprot:CAMPEP_0197584568 /NCGR_PEP_ID=MMETSP1326-20131121/7142_1 /TAXON_ID=1155430 /ORGANISM="Genus nov. species nov., Strain RCC2288" /LENGTH=413 /DNA_ID=CAMNT_0043148955 /DNA_START=277 /DNA_END=1515 /DNA_ORIENTATION=+